MTIAEYYEKNYGLTISNKKQPILRSSTASRKNSISVILIPEFLLISGIPQDFDERRRREISEYSILQPQEKLKRINNLINEFNSMNSTCSMNSVSKTLGIEISARNEEIKGSLLPPPLIQLGGR